MFFKPLMIFCTAMLRRLGNPQRANNGISTPARKANLDLEQ